MVWTLPLRQQDTALDFGAFYEILHLQFEKHPDYSLRVSEYIQIDERHTGRVDMPLESAVIDEDEEVIRLFF